MKALFVGEGSRAASFLVEYCKISWGNLLLGRCLFIRAANTQHSRVFATRCINIPNRRGHSQLGSCGSKLGGGGAGLNETANGRLSETLFLCSATFIVSVY